MKLCMVALLLATTRAFVIPVAFHQGMVQPRTTRLKMTHNNNMDCPLLLTFDLDDTLFPIAPVVQDSNHEMIVAMQQLGYPHATQDDYVRVTRQIRKDQVEISMTYSDLRRTAIQQQLSLSNQKVADSIFNVWLQERHAAAERYLFEGVQEMLECLRSTHSNLCIGAITNGRGNPLDMPSLQPYFDFCISGEDKNVFPHRKPHAGIYKAALAKYQEECSHHIDDYIWIHVGDCLANDVGASAKCGAQAIWYNPIETNESSSSRFVAASDQQESQPIWSTASATEIEKRTRLAQESKQYMTAEISNIAELPNAVKQVLLGVTKEAQAPCLG